MFEEEGIPVVDADRIARDVTARGQPAHAKIVRLFGEGILRPDGEIDRRRLGEIVFADPARRAELEAVTHPPIRRAIQEALETLAAAGHAVALVEAALIQERRDGGLCEEVIAVRCDPAQQVARLAARDGLTREEALRRLAAQMDPERKARLCNHVIDNSGSLESTRRQVAALAARLRAAASGR